MFAKFVFKLACLLVGFTPIDMPSDLSAAEYFSWAESKELTEQRLCINGLLEVFDRRERKKDVPACFNHEVPFAERERLRATLANSHRATIEKQKSTTITLGFKFSFG
ncbi:MAG: hypothetical protein LBU35_02785 [Holosporales bacterium]|jgi:hypothetical protein|nr:hypothetical protein [Holosporales bacterium]